MRVELFGGPLDGLQLKLGREDDCFVYAVESWQRDHVLLMVELYLDNGMRTAQGYKKFEYAGGDNDCSS